MSDKPALYESDVVEATCKRIEQSGWTVVSRPSTKSTGDDIVAKRNGKELRIEAKGGTSETRGTNRHGKVFSNNQVKTHVAQAFYRAAVMLSRPNIAGSNIAGLALPDDSEHRKRVGAIEGSINTLGMVVFFVEGLESPRVSSVLQEHLIE